MQSMLWLLQILIVFQISMLINFVNSESSNPNNFKWWRKHDANAHKHLIEEMSPSQFSHFKEEYNKKISLRHARYSKINKVMCKYTSNCNVSPAKKDVSSQEVDIATVLPKSSDPELESKLRKVQKTPSTKHEIDFEESPVVEDLNDFAAMPANRSHLQETDSKKPNVDKYSDISKMKMKEAGNKPAVMSLFQKTYNTSAPTPVNKEEEKRLSRLAEAHFNQALEETRCKRPKPIVVSVSKQYPHPHKIYAPPCIQLFRCTEESGCCTEPKSCMPLKTENVSLYFKIHTQVHGRGDVVTVEQLTFLNHTECRCKNKSKPNTASDSSLPSLVNDLQDESRLECTCPEPYAKRTMKDGTCICDCFANDMRCLKHQRGGGFALDQSERKCIEEGECTKPTCEHGDYYVATGRCPKNSRYMRKILT